MYFSLAARSASGLSLGQLIGRRGSSTALAAALPMLASSARVSRSHLSRVRLRTLLMCTPRPRWIPLHSMHINTPAFRLAQVGSGAPQSAQVAELGCACRTVSRALLLAAVSF